MGKSTHSKLPAVVLLVEDDQGDVVLVEEMLASSDDPGFDLLVAHRLDRAAAMLDTHDVDAILADLHLPDAESEAVVGSLRAHAPHTPIVLLSGYSGPEVDLQGAQDFVPKRDLTPQLLRRTLRYAIERGRLTRQLEQALMQNSDGLVIVDRAGVVRFANGSASRLLGKDRSELEGKAFAYPLETKDSALLEIDQPSGDPRYAEMRVADLEWDGRPASIVSLRDVTDRQRAEALKEQMWHAERLRAVGELAAGVAHEVNNPASYVLGNLETMLQLMRTDEELSRERYAATRGQMIDLLRESRSGIRRVIHIMRDLRNFARIDEDRLEVVDLNEVIESSCTMAKSEILHRAKLELDLDRTIPGVRGQSARLVQVFTNLILNAIQAMTSSGPHVLRVQTWGQGGEVFASVEDTGAGIPSHQIDRIFEPFFTTKERGSGTGLGLAIAAEAVRSHEGEIAVTSQPGKGTRFELRFPGCAPISTRPPTPSSPAPVSAAGRRRLLVVDDEIALLRVFARALKPHHEVVTATGGLDALAIMEGDQGFDAVLCDLMMPDCDGVAVQESLEAAGSPLASRMLFFSGGVFTDRVRGFIRERKHRFLEKPVEIEALLAAVDALVDETTR